MKKINIITVLSLLVTLVFTNGIFADDTVYTNGYFKFLLNDDETITIIEYFGDDQNVEIPMLIGGYPVVSISSDTFENKEIKQISAPETIPVEEVQTAVGEKVQIDTFDRDNQVISTIMPKQESIIPVTPVAPGDDSDITYEDDDDDEVVVDFEQEAEDTEIVFEENDITIDESNFGEDVVDEEDDEIIEDNPTTPQQAETRSSYTPIYVAAAILLGCLVIYIIKKINKK